MSDPPPTGIPGSGARDADDGTDNASNSAASTDEPLPFARAMRWYENNVRHGGFMNSRAQTNHPLAQNRNPNFTAPSATSNAAPVHAAVNHDFNTPQTTNTMQGRGAVAVGVMNLNQQFVASGVPPPTALPPPTLPPSRHSRLKCI